MKTTASNIQSNIAVDTQIINTHTLIIVIIFSILLLIICASYIDAKWIRINDFFTVGALFFAIFHINDTLTDILFTINITNQDEYPSQLLMMLLIASSACIFIPALMTIYQLHTSMNKWRRNEELAVWIGDNVKILYMISVLTGNSFVAVYICTSYMFHMQPFQMPLSKTQLLAYKTKMIYSTMLFEVMYFVHIHIPILLFK